ASLSARFIEHESISSGEIGLVQHMRDGGKIAKAGQEVRMIAIAREYAAVAGITGGQTDEAIDATTTCFMSWLKSRGGGGNQ
ncbi:hypothetical protein ACVBEF_14835, partial [Glaciimonas sp. GG7]